LALFTPDDTAAIDFDADAPTIRFGTRAPVVLTPTGVQFKKSDKEKPWSKETTKSLLDTIAKDQDLIEAAMELRTAWMATYPEYCYRRKAGAPPLIGKRRMAAHASLAKFGTTKSKSGMACNEEKVVETVTTTVTHERDVILTAAEQFKRCNDRCDKSFGDDATKFGDLLVCKAGCTLKSFVDLVTGTLTVVEQIVEEVVHLVTVCKPTIPKGRLPNPFGGMLDLPGLMGATPGATTTPPTFSPELVKQAKGVLKDLTKNLPPIVTCLAGGEWKVTTLSDLHLDIAGVGPVPFGVTVCLDRTCTAKIMGAGSLDMIGTIAAVVGLANGVPGVIAGLGVTAAVAAVLTPLCMMMIAMIAVVLVHLVIVAGELLIYEGLGAIPNGACITHPSLPVVAAGVINPVLGILALANTPLVVTPA